MTRVKICGISEKSHALGVTSAGSDFIGLVFAPSKRQVTPAQAQEIVETVKENSETTETVGVFVNMPTPAVNKVARLCNLDWVQLSGDETWAYCQQIEKPIIKAIRIRAGESVAQIVDYLASGDEALAGRDHRYLVDSRVEGAYGGTGVTADWPLAQEIAGEFPIIIAGGLTPENVTGAIKMVAPWGVDVSSGVETNGIKSTVKIKAFIDTVRRLDDS
jgi:phosphoribosylanthranilate isomerase